jgi:colicin import membrane protein
MPDPTPTPDPKPDPAPDPTPAPDPKPDPEPTPDPKPETVTMPKDEAERLRRKVAEADAAERKRKREEEEAAGNHAEVVKGVEGERDSEKSKREGLEAELESERKAATVATVASRLKFNDPADALLHLPADTANDEKAIEKALKKVADEKKYLVGGQGSRTAAPGGGGDPVPPTDIEDAIRKAEAEGDVTTSTRLKRQKLLKPQG